jgi:hypothetical protein
MARPKRIRLENDETTEPKVTTESKFIQIVERYLAKTDLTKEQFAIEIIKIGEAQYYRWKRGENVPTKSMVTRVAVHLALCLDKVCQKDSPDPFPYSDRAGDLINELLEASGHIVNVGTEVNDAIQGKSWRLESSWDEIVNHKSWRLGFISDVDPKWIKQYSRPGNLPFGKAIEYAERIGNLLGITTEWKYVSWQNLPMAIAERQIHATAPFMLRTPGRLLQYLFSDPWIEGGSIGVSAITLPKIMEREGISEEISLTKLSPDRIQCLCISNEIGSWKIDSLGYTYLTNDPIVNESLEEAVNKLKNWKSELIPILFVDDIRGQELVKKEGWEIVNVEFGKSLKFHPAFAFHPAEKKLVAAVNYTMGILEN